MWMNRGEEGELNFHSRMIVRPEGPEIKAFKNKLPPNVGLRNFFFFVQFDSFEQNFDNILGLNWKFLKHCQMEDLEEQKQLQMGVLWNWKGDVKRGS